MSFLIEASLRSISGASSVVPVVSSEAILCVSTCFLFVRAERIRSVRLMPRYGLRQSCLGRTFAGHVPESRLDFQLSLAQPLLLGESAFRVGLEARRGRRDGGLECRPFDQQGHRFGQVLACSLRIRPFQEEGKASAIRRRRESAGRRYGIGGAGFKRLGTFEKGIDSLAEPGLGRGEVHQRLGVAGDLVGMTRETGQNRLRQRVASAGGGNAAQAVGG